MRQDFQHLGVNQVGQIKKNQVIKNNLLQGKKVFKSSYEGSITLKNKLIDFLVKAAEI